MPGPKRAQWSVNRSTFAGRVTEDGAVEAAIPMLDNNELVGTLLVSMTADRELTVVWDAEPGAHLPVDYRAWQKG